MTVQDIITELNDHGFTDESTIAKVRAIQHTIWDLESRKGWPFLEATLDLSFDGVTDIPTNWPAMASSNAQVREVLHLRNLQTGRTIRNVRMEEFDDLTIAQGNAITGDPQLYYFVGNALHVWPQPAAAVTGLLRMRYIQTSAAIADVSPESALLIPPEFHRLISYGSLWKLYDMEDDPELASRFEAHYENGILQMTEAMWAKQSDRPDHIVMTDPDDYADESWGWGY